jgi:hypothetical protein
MWPGGIGRRWVLGKQKKDFFPYGAEVHWTLITLITLGGDWKKVGTRKTEKRCFPYGAEVHWTLITLLTLGGLEEGGY